MPRNERGTGVLTYDPESIQADLLFDGPLTGDEVREHAWPQNDDVPVVFGTTVDGDDVTLCNVRTSISSAIVYGYGRYTERASSSFLFFGAHLSEGADAPLVCITVELGNFTNWMSPPHSERIHEELDDGTHTFGVTYPVPPPFVVDLDVARVELRFGYVEGSDDDDLVIRTPSSIRVIPNEPTTHRELFASVVWPLQYFFSFATDAPCLLKRTRALAAEHWTREGDEFVPSRWPHEPEVIEPTRLMHAGAEVDYVHMLFSRPSLTDPAQVIVKWFALWSRHQDGLTLMLSDRIEPLTSPEVRFLLLAQGMEVFHRTLSDEFPEPDPDFEARRGRVLDLIDDPSDREWLEKLTRPRTGLSLFERLQKMIELGGDHAPHLVRSGFARVATDTRNYYTHYGRTGHAVHGVDLIWLTEESYLLVALVLLGLLDVDRELAWKMLTMSRRGSRLLNTRSRSGAISGSDPWAVPTAVKRGGLTPAKLNFPNASSRPLAWVIALAGEQDRNRRPETVDRLERR